MVTAKKSVDEVVQIVTRKNGGGLQATFQFRSFLHGCQPVPGIVVIWIWKAYSSRETTGH
jgi:hypothetical protein